MSYGPAFLRFGTHGGLSNVQILSIRKREKSIIGEQVVPNNDGLPQSEHYAGKRMDVEIRCRMKAAHTPKVPAELITLTGDFADDYVVDDVENSRQVGEFLELTYAAHNNSSVDYSVTYTDPA